MDHSVPPQRQSPESDRSAERMRTTPDAEKAPILVADETMARGLENEAVTTPLQVDRKITAASSVPEEWPRPPRMAQKIVSPGLLKMTEILGLFIALVGFVAASGTVVVTAKDFEQRAPATVLLIVGTLIFFGLLRLARRRRGRAADGRPHTLYDLRPIQL